MADSMRSRSCNPLLLQEVIDRLEDTFCRQFTIKSDDGPQFKSIEFKEYCEQHGVPLRKNTIKWAQVNGEVERQKRSH